MADGMTIAQLADRVGMTPRNIRAHQSKRLLFAPEIRGRVARYSGAHAARLELIGSLQREGFTLAAIKRLLDSPGSYSAIVADRRRRFREGSSDIPTSMPVSEEWIRELLPDLPDDLAETGLVWRDEHGQLVAHTLLVGVGRTLSTHGLPYDLIFRLHLDAAQAARTLGALVRDCLDGQAEAAHDIARIAVQLSATAFEIAFLEAATAATAEGDQ